MAELADKVGLSNGGDFADLLDNLVESGFLARDRGWNIAKQREQRLGYYRVSDNYVRFYLKYIEPYKARILINQYSSLPRAWLSTMGLQFENLVCNNGPLLFQILDLSPEEIVWAAPYVQTSKSTCERCQIDYLIQTKHHVLYLCEVKFSEHAIPFAVINEVAAKVKRLKIPRGFSVRCVLIHVNGVSERLAQDEFFSNIIDFGEFLNIS